MRRLPVCPERDISIFPTKNKSVPTTAGRKIECGFVFNFPLQNLTRCQYVSDSLRVLSRNRFDRLPQLRPGFIHASGADIAPFL